jgi:PAS domain S-box-containing protein
MNMTIPAPAGNGAHALFSPGAGAPADLVRALYDANLIGIVYWTAGAALTAANAKFLEIAGITEAQLPALQWETLAAREWRGAELVAHAELREHGRCAAYEKRWTRPDGTLVVTRVSSAVVDADTQQFVSFVADVTPRHELEQQHAELARLSRELTELREETETFSYSVAHDLRAPLRAIDAYTAQLEHEHQTALDDGARGSIDRLRYTVGRMAMLLDDIMGLVRLARMPLRRQDVDFTIVARAVVAEVRMLSGNEDIRIDVEEHLRISADPQLLRITLANLVANAVKFSAARAGAHIVIGRADAEFFVRDNGIGFDPAYSASVFAPFQRLHPISQYEGNGLGLTIVQRIVRRHGGSVRVETEPGGGATFFFTLGSDRS